MLGGLLAVILLASPAPAQWQPGQGVTPHAHTGPNDGGSNISPTGTTTIPAGSHLIIKGDMDASYGVGIDTFGVSRFAGAVTFSSSVYISSSIYVASGGLTVAAQSTFTAVVSFSTNPFLSVYNSVTQSPGGVTEVLELFDTVKSVQSIAFNTSDHNTVTINYAGVYSATCGLFVSGNTSNKIFLTLYDDSNPVAAARGYDNTTAGATITASQTLALAVGDVLQCKFQPGAAGQTFTGGQSFQYMTVVKVQ